MSEHVEGFGQSTWTNGRTANPRGEWLALGTNLLQMYAHVILPKELYTRFFFHPEGATTVTADR